MLVFVLLFSGAIYFRKRPAEHKSLMLLTVFNFLPAAIARIPLVPPQYMLPWAFGVPSLMAVLAFGWYTWKHRKFNGIFTAGLALVIASLPIRIMFAGTQTWHAIAAWLAL